MEAVIIMSLLRFNFVTLYFVSVGQRCFSLGERPKAHSGSCFSLCRGFFQSERGGFHLQRGVFHLERGVSHLKEDDFQLERDPKLMEEVLFTFWEGYLSPRGRCFLHGRGCFSLSASRFSLRETCSSLARGCFSIGRGVFPLDGGVFLLDEAVFHFAEGVFHFKAGAFHLKRAMFSLGRLCFSLGEGHFSLGRGCFSISLVFRDHAREPRATVSHMQLAAFQRADAQLKHRLQMCAQVARHATKKQRMYYLMLIHYQPARPKD